MFRSSSLPYLQRSISAAAAAGCLTADLFGDARLMGTVAGPEVCLYSRSRFLHSCDILTTSEVSQLFQRINNGSGSPYLTFTVQAVRFVVVIFYLPGYLGKTFCSLCCTVPSLRLLPGTQEGTATRVCVTHSTTFILLC